MKSPVVENASYIKDKSGYTDLQVLKSGAGYYIGTMYEEYKNGELVWQESGSRDSDYFKTEEQAKAYLKTIEISSEGIAEIVLRNHP